MNKLKEMWKSYRQLPLYLQVIFGILALSIWPLSITGLVIYLLVSNKVNWKVIAGIIFFLIFIFVSNIKRPSNRTVTTNYNPTTPQSNIIQPTERPKTIQDKLWEAVDSSLKTRKDVAIDYSSDDNSVIMTFYRDNYLDENHLVKEAYTEFVNFGIEAFKIPEIKIVNVQSQVMMTDQYGKKEKQSVVIVQMDRQTFEKFQWDNLRNLKSANIYQVFKNNAQIHIIVPGVLKNVDTSDLWIK